MNSSALMKKTIRFLSWINKVPKRFGVAYYVFFNFVNMFFIRSQLVFVVAIYTSFLNQNRVFICAKFYTAVPIINNTMSWRQAKFVFSWFLSVLLLVGARICRILGKFALDQDSNCTCKRCTKRNYLNMFCVNKLMVNNL